MDDFNFKDWPIIIYVISVSVLGGIAASVDRQRQDGKKLSVCNRFFLMLGDALTSGFAGLLTYWLYTALSQTAEPTPFLFFLVGMSGWLGVGSLKVLAAIWQSIMSTQGGKK